MGSTYTDMDAYGCSETYNLVSKYCMRKRSKCGRHQSWPEKIETCVCSGNSRCLCYCSLIRDLTPLYLVVENVARGAILYMDSLRVEIKRITVKLSIQDCGNLLNLPRYYTRRRFCVEKSFLAKFNTKEHWNFLSNVWAQVPSNSSPTGLRLIKKLIYRMTWHKNKRQRQWIGFCIFSCRTYGHW